MVEVCMHVYVYCCIWVCVVGVCWSSCKGRDGIYRPVYTNTHLICTSTHYCTHQAQITWHNLTYIVSHCITWFQTQLILTTCQTRYHSHLWDHCSTGQL